MYTPTYPHVAVHGLDHGLLTAAGKRMALLLSVVLLWEAACTSLQSDCSPTGNEEEAIPDDHSLLQSLLQLPSATERAGDGGHSNRRDETCEMLTNKVTYFSVNVCIGRFQCHDIILDSGSNNVLVPACSANPFGVQKECFSRGNSDTWEDSGTTIVQAFGQGAVDTNVGTDFVTMAEKTAKMVNGVFVMTKYHNKKMEYLEGIMGVGVGDGEGMDKVFIKRAGVERFSICFRDGGKDGALRLNIPELTSPMPTAGGHHWSLGLEGISVGAHAALMAPPDIAVCNPNAAVGVPGKESPCAMIVDSGTTQMLGSLDDVLTLTSALCQKWPRCAEVANSDPGRTAETDDAVFNALLAMCQEWLTEEQGLLEIPSLYMRIHGGGVFELSAWAWVTEFGRPGEKFCRSGFGVFDWNGVLEQPGWIIGTPLFYEYQVNFDYLDKKIEFKKGKCTACDEGVSLTETIDRRRPRWMLEPGIPRIPNYNRSFPL